MDPEENTNGEVQREELPPEQDVVEVEGTEEATEDDAPDGEDDGQEPGPDEVVEAAPAPRRSRENDRIRTLVEARDRDRQEHQRQIDELRQQIARPRQESPEEESARLALMSPEERLDYKLAKAERTNAQQMQVMQFQMADATDKASFDGMARVDPLIGKYRDKVETDLATLRRRGLNVTREEILANVIGREVLAKRGQVSKAKKAGAETIRRQTTRPANGSTNVSTQRGRTNDTPAKRLEGVLI